MKKKEERKNHKELEKVLKSIEKCKNKGGFGYRYFSLLREKTIEDLVKLGYLVTYEVDSSGNENNAIYWGIDIPMFTHNNTENSSNKTNCERIYQNNNKSKEKTETAIIIYLIENKECKAEIKDPYKIHHRWYSHKKDPVTGKCIKHEINNLENFMNYLKKHDHKVISVEVIE